MHNMELTLFKQRLQSHFDSLADQRRRFKQKNRYYYDAQTASYRFLIPPGKRVLELGCGTGELLAALEPAYGLGIDLSGRMIELARSRFPHLDFRQGDADDPESWGLDPDVLAQGFDYIILADLVGHLEDVQATFEALRPLCSVSTRVVLSYYNFIWGPALKTAERLGLKCPVRTENWLSPEDLENLLHLADFEPVKKERRLLCPKKIPLLHGLIELAGALPAVNRLCLSHYVVARMREPQPTRDLSVSIIVAVAATNAAISSPWSPAPRPWDRKRSSSSWTGAPRTARPMKYAGSWPPIPTRTSSFWSRTARARATPYARASTTPRAKS